MNAGRPIRVPLAFCRAVGYNRTMICINMRLKRNLMRISRKNMQCRACRRFENRAVCCRIRKETPYGNGFEGQKLFEAAGFYP